MNDIRVISAMHILRLHSMAPIRDFFPPSIVLLGEELNKTSEIYYNEIKVTEFVIQSASRLVMRIPDAALGKKFTSIKALTSVSVSHVDAEITFALNNPLQLLSGMDRLIQSWLLVFLTTPGSDVFDVKSGGGAQAIIGRTTTRDGKGVAADLALAIERTKEEIQRKQAKIRSLPTSEKLLSANLEQLTFDSSTGTLQARVSLQNMLGDQAEVSVG